MKNNLLKKLAIGVMLVATLITTPSVSAFAQVAQEDEQMQYKQYNKYWKEDMYKKYDLVNSWLKTEEAQESIKDKWGIVGTKQDEHVKDKALYYFWGGWVDYSKGYKVNYYTTKSDYNKADQKYLPKVSVTQKNGIITVKFKNLKNYAKKLKSEGLISATDYKYFWGDICFQPTKGVTNGIYGYIDKLLIWDCPDKDSGVGSWGAYGKIIKAKKWEYVQIDTRYGIYKGKVDFNVVLPAVGIKDNIYNYASEQFGLSNLDTCTSVCRTWSYVALSTTVNCKFDKSKTISPAKKPVIPNTGKFKKA